MTFSFFYFIGFVTTFLGTSWKPTLLVNAVLFFLSELCLGSTFSLKPVALLIGWASAVLIPSHFLFVQAEVFALTASTQMNIIIFTAEVMSFVVSTAIIFPFDNSPYIWLIVMILHCIYVFVLMKMSEAMNLIKRESASRVNYYAMLIAGLLVSDFVFMLSSSALNHGSTIVSTLVAAVSAFCVSFFLNYVMHAQATAATSKKYTPV